MTKTTAAALLILAGAPIGCADDGGAQSSSENVVGVDGLCARVEAIIEVSQSGSTDVWCLAENTTLFALPYRYASRNCEHEATVRGFALDHWQELTDAGETALLYHWDALVGVDPFIGDVLVVHHVGDDVTSLTIYAENGREFMAESRWETKLFSAFPEEVESDVNASCAP